ncbi:MAG: hypothetical protein QW666_04455 [Candidatus Woesearchaeota archaeon]
MQCKESNVEYYEYIRDALGHYGFGAVIEVTNGNPNRTEKKEQRVRVRRFLDWLVGDLGINLAYGVAYVKSNASSKTKREECNGGYSDFYIEVKQFDPVILRTAAFDALNCELNSKAKRKLEELLEQCELKRKSLGYLLSDKKEYYSDARGKIFECYVSELLAIMYRGFWWRPFFDVKCIRQYEPQGNTGKKVSVPINKGQIDILVACQKEKFIDVLKSLPDRFDKVKTYSRIKS